MTARVASAPATNKMRATYPKISHGALNGAVGRASRQRVDSVETGSVRERATCPARVGTPHSDPCEHIAEVIVLETGRPIEWALGAIDVTAARYDADADAADTLRSSSTEKAPGSELSPAAPRMQTTRAAARLSVWSHCPPC
jgi:succinate-semialdehyde dehydrogenase/glutarate-semialdehyde dehydrogenase